MKFLVYGNDLWRDPRVILRGQEAADGAIKVLPDMSGISVTFNIKDLPKFVPKTGNYLTVLTRSGTARYLIELVSCEKKAPPEPKPELEPAPVLARAPFSSSANVKGNRFVNDGELTIVVDDVANLPSASYEIHIGLRPASAGGAVNWVRQKVAAISPDRKAYSGKIALPLNDEGIWKHKDTLNFKYGAKGALLEAGLLFVLRQDFNPAELIASNAIVLYPSPDEAMLSLANQDKKISKLSDKVVFKLPANFHRAYPKLASGAAILRAKVKSNGAPVKVEAKSPTRNAREWKVKLKTNKKIEGGEVTLEFYFIDNRGRKLFSPEVPEIKGDLTILKIS
ncbi:MAG TPA: hypothetical protein QF533_12000 [Nitrospinota bacterium]|nr:hypothetical protein [Nitrospinota bacterium]